MCVHVRATSSTVKPDCKECTYTHDGYYQHVVLQLCQHEETHGWCDGCTETGG